MFKKIAAVCTAVLLSVGVAFIAAPAASADEAPPPEVVADSPAPAVEEAPAAEAPAEPVVVEAQSEPAPAVAPQESTTRVASSASVKLPICHTGSGVHWSYIAPDASGYNGHQHHDLDIYGLTEEECLAKNPPPTENDVDYVTVAWLALGGAPPHHFDVPQTILTSAGTDDPDLGALDGYIYDREQGLACETSEDIQVDVYYDDSTTTALVTGGVLTGPNNPTEHLIPGGAGVAWKFVHIANDTKCEVEPITVSPTAPTVKDLCGVGDDHYGLLPNVAGITYSRDGLDIVATLADGYAWGSLNGYVDNGDGTATYAFDSSQFTDVPCSEDPGPKVEYGDWVDGKWGCGDTTVEQTRTVITTTYYWSNDDWVANKPVVTHEEKSRVLTSDETFECPIETGSLPLTGSDPTPGGALAIGLLLSGGLALGLRRIRRSA